MMKPIRMPWSSAPALRAWRQRGMTRGGTPVSARRIEQVKQDILKKLIAKIEKEQCFCS